jgi:hypothetical protein
MRNDQVVRLWLNGGMNTTGSTPNGNLSTRDGRLYSYSLMIGDRMDNQVRIWDYTSSGRYYSQTTSCHVGLALSCAGSPTLMNPNFDAMIYDREIGADRKWCATRQAYE